MSNKYYLIIILILITAAALFYTRNIKKPAATPETMLPTMRANNKATSKGEIKITNGVKHSIPLEKLLSGGVAKDGIPSIDKPKFVSVAEADEYLRDEGLGIGLEIDGDKRFYPFQILVWHEIVNDVVSGRPIAVTYCPLCGTGIVFDRTIIDGEAVEFGVSGKLYNSNLVMYDRETESYWTQVGGEAVVGELTGKKLTVVPADNILWKNWKKENLDGQVLSKDTGFRRNYNRDPYGSYYTSEDILFPVNKKDPRLHPKEMVLGLSANGLYKAYPEKELAKVKILNDTLGSVDLIIFYDQENAVSRVFKRSLEGQTLEFKLQNGQLQDKQTNSIWNSSGEATGGQLAGKKLDQIPIEPSFWFAWVAFHPETALYLAE